MRKLILSGLLLIYLPATNAALTDRGNGLIYDADLNITWMADASYTVSSGYDSDGIMNWYEATEWANQLEFAGFSEWRLPTAENSGINGYDCLASEMCHLFYSELGGNVGGDIRQSHNDNYSLFNNIQGNYYWSGTSHPTDLDNAFDFNFEGGIQSSDNKTFYVYGHAWAVHDGDIGAQVVPIPASAWLFISGLLGLLSTKRLKNRIHN